MDDLNYETEKKDAPPAYDQHAFDKPGALNPGAQEEGQATGYAQAQALMYQQGYAPAQGYPVTQTFAEGQVHGQAVPTVVVTQPVGMPVLISTPRPPSQLPLSIVNTIFCNLICGVIAIVFSVMANDAADRGDMVTATNHARTAKIMNMVGIITGTICIIVLIILISTL